jgi:erythronate-4-phosphate dehydrogenase
MKIIVDENIPYGREAFSTLGEVVTRPGRAILPDDVRDAELLLVRSITKVNAALLEGSAVRFVATATIGEDHIDKAWLAAQGIGFSSAPGCNANSVGEYIVAALLYLAAKHGLTLEGMSLGVVGVGNVGSNVARKAAALGMTVVLNDPPRAEATGDAKYRPLDEILACDFITTHVPLTQEGAHRTVHLVDAEFLSRMKRGSFFLNTARGPICDNGALLDGLRRGHLRGAILDVWEGEPEVRLDVLDAVDIATPHIAGYSFDGKVNGTRQIYEAACSHLGVPADWSVDALLPEPEHPALHLEGHSGDLKRAVDTVYPLLEDDARMRAIKEQAPESRAAYFDMLRKTYPRRREFQNTVVKLAKPDSGVVSRLRGIGFLVQ